VLRYCENNKVCGEAHNGHVRYVLSILAPIHIPESLGDGEQRVLGSEG